MSNYTKVNRVLVGDGENSGTITSLSQVQKGDLVLLDSNSNILTATSAAALPQTSTVYVAMGTGPGKYIKSQGVEGVTIDSVETTQYDAPVQKAIALGYNGTDGSFVVQAGEEYRLRIHIKDRSRPNCQRPTIHDSNYTVKAGETATDAALALQCIMLAEDKGKSQVSGKVKVEVISNGTAGTPVSSCLFTKGSREVFKVGHGLSEGVLIKVQGKLYKVESVYSPDTFILTVPYQAASGTTSSVPTTVINSVGIEVTGLEQEGLKGIDEYEIINFNAVLTGADDYDPTQYQALSRVLTQMNPGQGYWKQVFDSEVGSRGYLNGTLDRISYDAKRVESNVVEGAEYGSVIMSHYNVHMADFAYRQHSPLQTEIYIPNGSEQGDASTDTNFIAILSAYVEKFGQDAIDLA